MQQTPLRPATVGTRPQLFVDGSLVAARDGVVERLHAAVKHPTPVLTAAASWERPDRSGLGGPVNVVYDPDQRLFRLWYASRGTITAGGSYREPAYQLYATSVDGIHFERPHLGLFEYAGSTENNILGEGTEAAIGHGMLDCPEMEAAEHPEFRYKFIRWTGPDEHGTQGVGVFFSADGLRWRPHEGNPVLPYIAGRNYIGDVVSPTKVRDTPFCYDPPGFPTAKYAAFPRIPVQVGRWERRSVGVMTCNAVSPNSKAVPFIKWSEPVLILAPDALDDEMAEARLAAARPVLRYDHPDDHHCQFYGMIAFRCGDLWLGLLWVFDVACNLGRIGDGNLHALVELQLVSSPDLIHWHRVGNRQPVLPRGARGTFDSAMIFYHSFPVPVGDEWWIYYAGFDTAHRSTEQVDVAQRREYLADVKAGRKQFSAIGLAKIRREGFVSLDAGAAGGTLTTRSLHASGSQLELNADVAPGGEIRVEVQDDGGQPLPGFEATSCTPVVGDSVQHRVRWGDRLGDETWRQQPVRVKFHLRQAQLYAFRFANAPAKAADHAGGAGG